MAIKNLLHTMPEEFLEMLWPTRCAGCDLPDTLLCEECENKLSLIDATSACPRCGAPYGAELCTECAGLAGERHFAFSAARAAATFEDVIARMIVLYKDGQERRLAPILARLLALAAQNDWRDWAEAIVFVPASADAFYKRGFDHMELIGKYMSEQTRIPLQDVLVRRCAQDQRILGRKDRTTNVQGTFEVLEPEIISEKDILLIDDVFTTGATLDVAAHSLLEAGAREVRVLVIGRVW